jgi:DHA3 family macrolide efflux protein-like MFS transporter
LVGVNQAKSTFPFALVVIVLVVRSLAAAFHMPAMQASIPLLAPEEHLTKVAGWGQTVSSVSNIAGPAVGMSLLAVSSLEWVLLLDVLGAVIACSFYSNSKSTENRRNGFWELYC